MQHDFKVGDVVFIKVPKGMSTNHVFYTIKKLKGSNPIYACVRNHPDGARRRPYYYWLNIAELEKV